LEMYKINPTSPIIRPNNTGIINLYRFLVLPFFIFFDEGDIKR